MNLISLNRESASSLFPVTETAEKYTSSALPVKAPLTTEGIRNAVPGTTLWDTVVSGLHLRVFARGKNFYLYYRTKGGQQRRPKLGRFGNLTLTQARTIAKEYLEAVARGLDPKGDQNKFREEPTVRDVYNMAWRDYWDVPRFHASGQAKNARNAWKLHLEPAFGQMKLSDVSPLKIRNWQETKKETPYGANRALEFLSRVFSFAEERDLIPTGGNPCRVVRGFKEVARSRYATTEEMKKIHAALDARYSNGQRSVAFLRTMFFTGARPRALEQARWSDFRIEVKEEIRFGVLESWGKTSARTGEKETVVFPEQALKEIEALPRRDDGLIFGVKLPRNMWKSIRKEIGCPDLRARDSRRTYATTAFAKGVQTEMIGKMLNHRSNQTTQIYAKLTDDSRFLVAKAMGEVMGSKG